MNNTIKIIPYGKPLMSAEVQIEQVSKIFIPRKAEKQYNIIRYNKQFHMKELLNSYNLNGHTLGFHPQT